MTRTAIPRSALLAVRAKAIARHHASRVGEDPVEILLAHRESDHADATAVAIEHRYGQVVRVGADRLGVGTESFGVLVDALLEVFFF